jgi:SAM-dependent methyltransferase
MSSQRLVSGRAFGLLLPLAAVVVVACMATGQAGHSGGPGAPDAAATAASARTKRATDSLRTAEATDQAGSSKGAPTAPPASGVMPDVDYWATPQPVVDRMLELARVKASDLVYDLGCGDARSLVTAAERYGARGVGFDIDPKVVALARDNVHRHGVEQLVRIEQVNIFTLDLSPADVVFLYLTPRINWRLVPQLEKLRRGSRIVVHEYEIPGARPLRIVKMRGPPDGPPGTDLEQRTVTHTIYLWKVPWQKQPTDWTEADRATDPDQGR